MNKQKCLVFFILFFKTRKTNSFILAYKKLLHKTILNEFTLMILTWHIINYKFTIKILQAYITT